MKNFNIFYIITNRIKDRDLSLTRQIADYIRCHGGICYIREDFLSGQEENPRHTDPTMIPPEVECILVLGGDGTLLQAARDVLDRQIPLLGINLGTLGYLAEINRQSIYPALDRLMQGKYKLERRMMLQGKVYRGKELLGQDIALNDIVISRLGGLRVVDLNTYVNKSRLTSYRADGVIVSTPTGSTGYSLSAGGPIISPAASLFLMTPLAPHTLNSRSVVLPPENEISIEIGRGRDETREEAVVYFDSDTCVPMITGDRVEITRSRKDTLIVKIHSSSFLDVLSKKMRNA